MKRILTFILIFVLTFVPVTVHANEGNDRGWFELLEVSSVQANGENWFSINGTSGTFSIPVPQETILRNVDMILWHPNADTITSISCTNNGATSNLTAVYLGNNLSRVYGKIPNKFYENLSFTITKATSSASTFQVLSCRVSALQVMDFSAHAELRKSWGDQSPLQCPANFSVAGDSAYTGPTVNQLIRVDVTDWQKYDAVTIYGSFSNAALTSARASIGNKGLPFEISYMESVPTGTESLGTFSHQFYSHTETTYLSGSPDIHDETSFQEGDGYGDFLEHSAVTFGGNVLYTITIDLTGIDRAQNTPLVCVFTILENPAYGYQVNVQNVSGAVVTADTSSMTWWTRFTTFMTDLFGGDTEKADQFQDDMQEANNALTDANEQLDTVTKPAVDDVPLDPSIYLDADGTAQAGQIVQSLLGNELVLPMASITLIVGLAAFIIF